MKIESIKKLKWITESVSVIKCPLVQNTAEYRQYEYGYPDLPTAPSPSPGGQMKM